MADRHTITPAEESIFMLKTLSGPKMIHAKPIKNPKSIVIEIAVKAMAKMLRVIFFSYLYLAGPKGYDKAHHAE